MTNNLKQNQLYWENNLFNIQTNNDPFDPEIINYNAGDFGATQGSDQFKTEGNLNAFTPSVSNNPTPDVKYGEVYDESNIAHKNSIIDSIFRRKQPKATRNMTYESNPILAEREEEKEKEEIPFKTETPIKMKPQPTLVEEDNEEEPDKKLSNQQVAIIKDFLSRSKQNVDIKVVRETYDTLKLPYNKKTNAKSLISQLRTRLNDAEINNLKSTYAK